MTSEIRTEPLTAEAFAPFGDVLDASGVPDRIINEGRCGRYHDLAQLDFSDGRAGISIFHSEATTLPVSLALMERHPKGSQAFLPLSKNPFLVVVAEDNGGEPSNLRAFITQPGQGINFHRNIWHGVLMPLADPGLFAVVDRIGEGANLEEYRFGAGIVVIGT